MITYTTILKYLLQIRKDYKMHWTSQWVGTD